MEIIKLIRARHERLFAFALKHARWGYNCGEAELDNYETDLQLLWRYGLTK
jgi:hypothetical protein